MRTDEIVMESLNNVIERLLKQKHETIVLKQNKNDAEIFDALVNLKRIDRDLTAYALATLIDTGLNNEQREVLKKYITPIIIDSLVSFYKKSDNCLDGECLYIETIDFLSNLYPKPE